MYVFVCLVDLSTLLMYRNEQFGDLLMYSSREKGAIPAAHVYYALYRELPPGLHLTGEEEDDDICQ